MAYTRPWAQVMALPGTRMAHEIDDENREGHVDFTERLSDILVDVEADPWVLKLPGVTGAGSVNFQYAAAALTVISGTPTYEVIDVHPSLGNGSISVRVPIVGWQGSRITNFSIRGVRNHILATLVGTLYRVTDVTVVAVATASILVVDSDYQSAFSATLAEDMIGGYSHYIEVVVDAGPTALGVDARLMQLTATLQLAGTF